MKLLFWWNFVEAGLCDLDKKEMRFSFDLTKVFPIGKTGLTFPVGRYKIKNIIKVFNKV